VRRVKLKSLRAGVGPFGAEVEIGPADRDQLHPLFVVLRDRRALLDAPEGREDNPYVVQSINEIRLVLTETLTRLGPDSDARQWVEQMRAACREFLTEVEQVQRDPAERADFSLALAQLREMFLAVAEHVATKYGLVEAQELARAMRAADERHKANK
jgi:hypothetical protein